MSVKLIEVYRPTNEDAPIKIVFLDTETDKQHSFIFTQEGLDEMLAVLNQYRTGVFIDWGTK